MKRVGFVEDEYYLEIVVGLSYIHELAKDITIAFDIDAEDLFSKILIRKTPIVESCDIRSIKRFVHRWIDDKMQNIDNIKAQKDSKLGYCRHCKKPIYYEQYVGVWYHTKNSARICEDGNQQAEP